MHDKANNSRSHKNISKDSRFLHNCLFCLVTYYNWCDWFLPSLILWRKTWQVRQLVTPLPVTYEPQPPSKRKTSQRDRALAEGHWLLPEMSHFLLGGLYTNKEIFLWTAYHKNITFTQDLCTSSWIKCLNSVSEPQLSVHVIAGVLKLMKVEWTWLTSCSRLTGCYSSVTTVFTKHNEKSTKSDQSCLYLQVLIAADMHLCF